MSKLKLVAAPIRCGSPAASAAIMLGVALATAPTAALSDAQVRGSPEAVTIEAKNTSVEEILTALSSAFDLHYRSSASLERRLTGNYQGSLQRVMKRVLDGYSYFARIGDGRIDLTVVDAPNTTPATGASPAFRVVALPADPVPAQPSFALAANGPPVIPNSLPTSSAGVAGPPESDVPAQPAPAIAVVEPPVPPGSPAIPLSRNKNDHFALADGKELRPSPPRKVKTASSSRHVGKGKYHVRRTSRVRVAALCRRPIRSFGLAMTSPVWSYYWLPWDLRSVPDSRAEAIRPNSKGLKMSCRLKQPR
jgi:hypothetical protein